MSADPSLDNTYHRVSISIAGSKLSVVLTKRHTMFLQDAVQVTGERVAITWTSPNKMESVVMVVDPRLTGVVNLMVAPPEGATEADVAKVLPAPLTPAPRHPVRVDVASLVADALPIAARFGVQVPSEAPAPGPAAEGPAGPRLTVVEAVGT